MSSLAEPLMPASESGAAAAPLGGGGVASCIEASKPVINLLIEVGTKVMPFLVWAYTQLKRFYNTAPKNVLQALFGLALCFFGGTFCASVAAIEAFRLMGGWDTCKKDVEVVFREAQLIGAASAKDDEVDADNDGVADVKQIGTSELAQRKLVLTMRTVTEPKRLQSAAANLWGAYLAVLATLKLQFAQTTALALGMCEAASPPVMRVVVPPVDAALGQLQLAHWAETIVDTVIKVVAILVAWWLEVIISAFYSAIRGGKLFAQAVCAIVIERGWSSFDPDKTHVDEMAGFLVAGVGFLFQLFSGFSLAFPLNLIFLPLELIEWLLRWQITFSAGEAPGATTGVAG